jgi:signal transduction histidine kinase
LLNNAIKFTGDNGRVKIVVNNLFREVEIIISDTGIGIPEGDLPYIFQKFTELADQEVNSQNLKLAWFCKTYNRFT